MRSSTPKLIISNTKPEKEMSQIEENIGACRVSRAIVVGVIIAVCSLINPMVFGCSDNTTDTVAFDEEEMKAVVEGRWEGTLEFEDSTSESFQLELWQRDEWDSQGGTPDSGDPARCHQQSLVTTAHACVRKTEMSMSGELILEEETHEVEGVFYVFGRYLTSGELILSREEGESFLIQLVDGKFEESGAILREGEADPVGTFTLVRS